MHEVDIRVGLQEVAPGALADMRLAGDEEHAQLVAHAVDRQRGAVVDRGQLAVEAGGLDLDDVGAGMGDLDVDPGRLAGGDDGPGHHLAVAAHGDGDAGAGGRALVLDAVADRLALADDAEARGGGERHAAVALALLAGDDGVHRRAEAERGDGRGDVVDPPVGEEDGAGHPLGRHVGEAGGERGEQARAVHLAGAAAGIDEAHLGALLLQPGEAGLELGAGGVGHLRAVAELLAGALVDDDGDDGGERLALLAGQRGVGERQQARAMASARNSEPRVRETMTSSATAAATTADGDQPGQRDERIEGEAEIHWPSLSSSAGTWTWSAL